MKPINDEQEQAIHDAISREHSRLHDMYKERENIESRHITELDDFVSKIGKQENKVEELCEGRIKITVDSDNKLILDLTDKD